MRLWNRTKKNKSRGQATTELAICATLIIVMFAAMLRYGQTMNFQQQLQMKAFRQALKYSRDKGREVSYTIIKDKRGVNPFNFFGVPEDNRLMASATAAWIKSDFGFKNIFEFLGLKDPEDIFDYYEINGEVFKLRPIKVKAKFEHWIIPEGNWMELWMPIMVLESQYRKQRDVDAKIERKETHSGIITERSYSVSRDIQTKLVMYDKEDMEREILESLREGRSRREREKYSLNEIVQDLIAETLFIVGLSLGELELLSDEYGSTSQWINAIIRMFTGMDVKKIVLAIVAYIFFKVIGGHFLGDDPEVVEVRIVEGYRQYETWQEQDTWEGGSSWQAPF